MKISKYLLALLLCIPLLGCKGSGDGDSSGDDPSSESSLINDLPSTAILREMTVTTDKARYSPGETVTFSSNRSQSVLVRYWHLGTVVSEVIPEDSSSWTWTPPGDDFKGYYVEVLGKNAEGVVKTVGSTAVDVSSDWTKFPRYGFLSKFGSMAPSQVESVLANLKNYHINGLQYYDWMYDHHHPLAGTPEKPDDEWPSIIGDICTKATVEEYISQAHGLGMASMFYDLCYGALAWAEDDGVSKEWYLFKDKDHSSPDYHPLSAPFRSNIYLVDPGNAGWLKYFAERVDEVYKVFDFDGFHIDQLGNRGTLYDYGGSSVDLPAGYGKFLSAMKSAQPDKKLAFNAVSRYGQIRISAAPSDFLYNEIWDTKFSDIVKVMTENRSLSSSKKTVLAAYMNYGKSSGTFNTASVLLADAVIFALGGDHLELGEHMLSSEYFPNTKLKMDAALQSALPSYYDFLTGYENILRDGTAPYTLNISSSDVNLEKWGPEQGKVNYYVTQTGDRLVVHLLNFSDAAHLDWRDDSSTQKEPSEKGPFTISIRSSREVSSVWTASPDIDGGVPRKAEYKASGLNITVTVPSLKYWTMIVIE